MSKKVLLITDSNRWALHHRAVALKKYLKDFNFDIYRFEDLDKHKINFNNYDIVYLLNWPIFHFVEKFIDKNRNYKLVTTVSSHCNRKSAKEMKNFFNTFDKVSVSNRFYIKNFLQKLKEFA